MKAFRFYLSAEQCNALNDAREAIEEWRIETTQMRIKENLLIPDPKMDDSYWLKENE